MNNINLYKLILYYRIYFITTIIYLNLPIVHEFYIHNTYTYVYTYIHTYIYSKTKTKSIEKYEKP